MKSFEDFKKTWKEQQAWSSPYHNRISFDRMIKSRVKKHTDKAM